APASPSTAVNRPGGASPGPVADALAGVVADPAVDRGQRVVGDELPPRLLVPARLGVRQPGLDVLAGRAARVAGRQQVDVDGTALAHRPGPPAPVQQIGQRCHIGGIPPPPPEELPRGLHYPPAMPPATRDQWP